MKRFTTSKYIAVNVFMWGVLTMVSRLQTALSCAADLILLPVHVCLQELQVAHSPSYHLGIVRKYRHVFFSTDPLRILQGSPSLLNLRIL